MLYAFWFIQNSKTTKYEIYLYQFINIFFFYFDQGEDKDQFAVLYKGLLATHHVYVALQVILQVHFPFTLNIRSFCFKKKQKLVKS